MLLIVNNGEFQMPKKKMKPVIVGSIVAFNELEDAAWFEVLKKNGDRIDIREHGTEYAVQHHFASCVKQVR